MPRSVDRFLTTHTGSLPRPDDLIQMMYAKEEGRAVDRAELNSTNSPRRQKGGRQADHRRR